MFLRENSTDDNADAENNRLCSWHSQYHANHKEDDSFADCNNTDEDDEPVSKDKHCHNQHLAINNDRTLTGEFPQQLAMCLSGQKEEKSGQ